MPADEPLVEFIRTQLKDLLQIVILTCKGKRVRVNGFKLLNNLEKEINI